MDVKYDVLKECTLSLLRRIDDLEHKVIDNECKLIFDVHDEMNNMIACYRGNFKDYWNN